jgi:hypothetical protein
MTTFRSRANQGKVLCIMAAMAIVLYHHVLLLMLDSGYLLVLFRRQGNQSTDCAGNDENNNDSRRPPPDYSLRGAVVFERQDQKGAEHSTTMIEERIHEEEDENLLKVRLTAPSFPLRGGGNGDDEINDDEDRAKFLFAPSIYGMAFPEDLEGTSSEDGTRAGNEGNVSIPTPSSKVSILPSPEPNAS